MFAYYAEGVGNADIRELVLGVFHLSCSKVYQGALDGVLFVAEDEDVWATDGLHQRNSVTATNCLQWRNKSYCNCKAGVQYGVYHITCMLPS